MSKNKSFIVNIPSIFMLLSIFMTSCLSCVFDTERMTFEYKDGKVVTWIDRGGIDVQDRSTIILDSLGEKEYIDVFYNIHSITVGDTLVVILDSLAYLCSPVAVESLNRHGIPVKISENYARNNIYLQGYVEEAKGQEWPSKESKGYYRKKFYE